jgi:prepilin-type N-terminal cleavage/methylation domain-containing protein
MRKNFNIKGFTLIELIIVIAVIALLAAATFVAVDPAKRIGMARDAQRWSDITAIADAIWC